MNLAAKKELWAEHGADFGASLAAYLLTERAASLHGRTVRMADGKLSLYSGGTYGPVLGEKLDWRLADFEAVLKPASAELQVDSFTPYRANS